MSTVPPRSAPSIATLGLLVAAFVVVGLGVERLDPFPALRLALRRPSSAVPSTASVPEAEVARGWPLLSVQIDPVHLYDEATGLLRHVNARGREWERPATTSYFEDGRLQFATGVGLRVHGGLTRTLSEKKSFRLYFRRQYGIDQFRPGVLFDRRTEPLRHLVLHNDVRTDAHGRDWHFVNPLAYDITAAAGALVAQTKPARFFLNGEWQGVYVLTERLRDNMIPDLLVARFGHASFAVDNRSWERLWREVTALRPLRMEGVAALIDLDNLTRWFIAVLFCATEDAFQGPQLRDLSDPDGRWFFINWDMDHSFMDLNQQADVPWEHDTFRTVLERAGEARRGWRLSEVRSIVLTTLLAEDPAYREYFKRTFVDVLNHRVTPAFLDERFRHYERIGRDYGVEDRAYLPILREFLTRRPAVLWTQAEQYLNTRPSHRVSLQAGTGNRLEVDGHAVGARFEGRYFPGMSAALSVTGAARPAFSHWTVNGQRRGAAPTLEVRVDRDLTIEAVFVE